MSYGLGVFTPESADSIVFQACLEAESSWQKLMAGESCSLDGSQKAEVEKKDKGQDIVLKGTHFLQLGSTSYRFYNFSISQ